uniref:SET domain-containing protein n=1 Tax=Caenorhabditis tropicalis TaxID=1561998 RepID=A0A1I7T4M4_9PELO
MIVGMVQTRDSSVAESDASNGGSYEETSKNLNKSDETFYYPMHLLTKDDFNEQTLKNIVVDNDVLKTLCVTRVSHRIRRLLRHFGNSEAAEEIIYLANDKCRENPCTQIRQLPSIISSFPNTSRKGLFATRDILEGEFVIAPAPVLLSSPKECGRDRMGVTLPNIILYGGLQSDFNQYEILDVPCSRKRKRSTDSFQVRRKMRAIEASRGKSSYTQLDKYCSDDEDYSEKTAYEKYDICIDLTNSTDELRTMRRNCLPNCAIRYVMLHQRMEVFITAQKHIEAGEELTLLHDYDSNMSSRVIQCTHPYEPDDICLHEAERQETIKKYVKSVSGKCNNPSTSTSFN